MADPLSVTASIAGVISLGIQTSQFLFDYYKAVQGQDDEVARITKRLQGVLDLLEWVSKEMEMSRWNRDQEELLDQVHVHIQECEDYIRQLQQEAKKFKEQEKDCAGSSPKSRFCRVKRFFRRSSRTTSRLRRQLTYPFHRETMEKLEKNIADTIPKLGLVQQLLQQRSARHNEEIIDNTREMIRLVRTHQVAEKIYQWLKPPDATVNFNLAWEKRHKNTGLWLVNGPAFASWLDNPNSFLWLYGSTGTGKSILSSTAIQYAFLHKQAHPRVGIAFFYFKFDDESKQDVSAMLRALILQLSSQTEGIRALERLYGSYRTTTPPTYALMECLGQIIQELQDVYIILDALDECPRNQRSAMLRALVDLHASSERGLHILATSRDEVDIRDMIGDLADDKIPMRNSHVEKDIALFISQHLRQEKSLEIWAEDRDLI